MMTIEQAATTPAPPTFPLAGGDDGPGPGGRMGEAAGAGSEDPWAFAERVWSGLRPHLRTRLWVLESLRRRGRTMAAGGDWEAGQLDRLADEARRLEDEVDEVLRRRRDWESFSNLLAGRLATCLSQLERVQQDQNERGDF
ncbi:MAG: hypothetical protein KF833_00165 [Verrucomicrobiae bacterium]|nr:hypothetical protein [Verrucomicrobiae bacterium]